MRLVAQKPGHAYPHAMEFSFCQLQLLLNIATFLALDNPVDSALGLWACLVCVSLTERT
jgi:hypothetical protein